MGYAADGFITNVKELQRKEYLKNTHMKHTTSVKKSNEQKQLDVAIKDLRKQQQQQQQEKSTEVEAKYKNLQ